MVNILLSIMVIHSLDGSKRPSEHSRPNEPTDVYRAFSLTTEHTFFSSTHRTSSQIIYQAISRSNFKIEIMLSTSLIKMVCTLEINRRTGQFPCIHTFNSTSPLSHQQIKENKHNIPKLRTYFVASPKKFLTLNIHIYKDIKNLANSLTQGIRKNKPIIRRKKIGNRKTIEKINRKLRVGSSKR